LLSGAKVGIFFDSSKFSGGKIVFSEKKRNFAGQNVLSTNKPITKV
jgi:hypothetical protein